LAQTYKDLQSFCSFGLLLFLEKTDGYLHDGLFCLLLNFLHLFVQMVLQVHSILLGVDVDFALLVQRLKSEVRHPLSGLLLCPGAISRHRHQFALLFEVLREREVVLEAKFLDVLWLVASVGVKVKGKLELLIHRFSYIYMSH